jgi:aerobic carbon-monoxide dehydrogenase medium subunit
VKPFTFHQPSTVSEAVGLLAQHGRDARPLAGGQSLMLEMKERKARPAVLVSLSGLAELKGWTYAASGELEVGATTTYAQLIAAQGLRGWHPVVSAVAGDLADRPVRTMGTIGGSLCQADPRFDMPVLVVGTGAVADTVSPSGVRTRDAAELFAEGGGSALAPEELLTRIRFPEPDGWTGVAFEKFRIRQFDSALASVLCALSVGPDGRVTAGRLTVGAVRPNPFLVGDAAQLLTGLSRSDDPVAAVTAVVDEVLPPSTVTTHLQRYQRELVPALVRHAVARAFEQSGS